MVIFEQIQLFFVEICNGFLYCSYLEWILDVIYIIYSCCVCICSLLEFFYYYVIKVIELMYNQCKSYSLIFIIKECDMNLINQVK